MLVHRFQKRRISNWQTCVTAQNRIYSASRTKRCFPFVAPINYLAGREHRLAKEAPGHIARAY
jgi:hypothetical protein